MILCYVFALLELAHVVGAITPRIWKSFRHRRLDVTDVSGHARALSVTCIREYVNEMCVGKNDFKQNRKKCVIEESEHLKASALSLVATAASGDGFRPLGD